MMVSNARCYIPRFKAIGPVVLEKKICKVFTIYWHGGHLGHVTWTKYINFLPPLLEGCIWNLNEIG